MEETVEKLDQEITLSLQRIDSNLSYCFNRITKQIIPRVTQYGSVCEEIMDHASWLGSMFQQTGNVDMAVGEPPLLEEQRQPAETLFPQPELPRDGPWSAESSDNEEAEGSTLQRQRRKRKVSLLLQQEFGSSSSAVPSPRAQQGPRPDSSTTGEYRGLIDSSPVKPQPTESTKQVPKPGTVIHFSTGA